MEQRKGWIRVVMSRDGTFASNAKEGAFSVDGNLLVEVPATPETQEEAITDYTRTFETPSGEVKLEGLAAVVAQQYYSKYEALRSEARGLAADGKDLTLEQIQGWADAWRPMRGQSLSNIVEGRTLLDEDEYENMTREEMIADLRKKGLL